MVDKSSSSFGVEPTETSPQFRKIVVDRAMGFIDSIGLRAIFYSENIVYNEMLSSIPRALHNKKIKRTIECELIMSPQTLRDIHRFLGEQLTHYETLYGKIPTSQELELRRKRFRESKLDESQTGLE